MTDEELDHVLRPRLERLAHAAPVPEPIAAGAQSVTRGPVIALRSFDGRGVASALVVLIVGVAIWAGSRGSVSTPGSSPSPSTAVVTEPAPIGTSTDGTFELTVAADKARYAPGEPIGVEASLAYVGPGGSIEIVHGQGADSGPMSFGIEEPVIEGLTLGPGWLLSCERSTLTAGLPLVAAFEKSGGYSSLDARAEEYRAFLADPQLRLGPGTWHVFVIAHVGVGDCTGQTRDLRAEITIEVGTTDVAVPSTEPGALFPAACTDLGVSVNQCAGFAAWAIGQAGAAPGHVAAIEMRKATCPGAPPCPSGATGYVVTVRVVTDGGTTSDELINCTRMPGTLGGINFLCDLMATGAGQVIEFPFIHSAISSGYRDTPCSGEAPIGCATPLPTIEPRAMAESEPLSIGSRQITIDHAGPYAIVLGQATLPNGILSAASAAITSSPTDPLVAYEGYQLTVTSLDGAPAFDNLYAHGWRSGVERVEVTLTFTVLTFDPGAAVVVSDVDVH